MYSSHTLWSFRHNRSMDVCCALRSVVKNEKLSLSLYLYVIVLVVHQYSPEGRFFFDNLIEFVVDTYGRRRYWIAITFKMAKNAVCNRKENHYYGYTLQFFQLILSNEFSVPRRNTINLKIGQFYCFNNFFPPGVLLGPAEIYPFIRRRSVQRRKY